jgi:hypothetical protein
MKPEHKEGGGGKSPRRLIDADRVLRRPGRPAADERRQRAGQDHEHDKTKPHPNHPLSVAVRFGRSGRPDW